AAPSPTPAEPSIQSATGRKERTGNCHSVITSAPAVHQPASGGTQANRKPGVAISEEHPVIIDARECEQAGKVYTLRGDVEIQFADYTFHGDLVTFDSAIGDVAAKGHASLDGGRRDIHISGKEGAYNIH